MNTDVAFSRGPLTGWWVANWLVNLGPCRLGYLFALLLLDFYVPGKLLHSMYGTYGLCILTNRVVSATYVLASPSRTQRAYFKFLGKTSGDLFTYMSLTYSREPAM